MGLTRAEQQTFAILVGDLYRSDPAFAARVCPQASRRRRRVCAGLAVFCLVGAGMLGLLGSTPAVLGAAALAVLGAALIVVAARGVGPARPRPVGVLRLLPWRARRCGRRPRPTQVLSRDRSAGSVPGQRQRRIS